MNKKDTLRFNIHFSANETLIKEYTALYNILCHIPLYNQLNLLGLKEIIQIECLKETIRSIGWLHNGEKIYNPNWVFAFMPSNTPAFDLIYLKTDERISIKGQGFQTDTSGITIKNCTTGDYSINPFEWLMVSYARRHDVYYSDSFSKEPHTLLYGAPQVLDRVRYPKRCENKKQLKAHMLPNRDIRGGCEIITESNPVNSEKLNVIAGDLLNKMVEGIVKSIRKVKRR